MYQLQRHPFAVESHFVRSLVLAYALPAEVLRPLVPPGMELDAYNEFGFVAIAMVDAAAIRPVGMPAHLGRRCSLTGYRIFVRHRTPEGRLLRGLYILRSDTNSRLMKFGGNLFTHYKYRHARVDWKSTTDSLEVNIKSADGLADLDVQADIANETTVPARSPFEGTNDARRFSGPLPWTFDYESQTHSIVKIRGRRSVWKPKPVAVDVRTCNFFEQPEFGGAEPILANSFYVSDLPYQWDKGVRSPLTNENEK